MKMDTENGLIIMEGIFGLREELVKGVSADQIFRIVCTPLSQINLDETHYMSNQLLRLLRRISRDFLHRGRDARNTIKRWPSVLRGEERNIFPFLKNADVVFNSSLDYEVPVLKVKILWLPYCLTMTGLCLTVDRRSEAVGTRIQYGTYLERRACGVLTRFPPHLCRPPRCCANLSLSRITKTSRVKS
jgi:hypothetical protein